MKGDASIIKLLNEVLKNELTAISQYFMHARMYANWGLEELAEHERKESIDEMKHADVLIERILFLEGLPNMQALDKLLVGQDIEEMIRCDLTLEMTAIPLLRKGIEQCEGAADYVTRELLEDILESEEEHVDWLETQLDLIKRTGIKNYTQAQMS